MLLLLREIFFSLLKTLNNKRDLPEGVLSLQELTYTANVPFDSSVSKYDTMIDFDGQEEKLFLTSMTVETFISARETELSSFDRSGKKILTSTRKYDLDGRLLYESQDFGDSPAAELMNSSKEFQYDGLGQLARIIQNMDTLIDLTYIKEGLIGALKMNSGIGKIEMVSEKHGDTIRYDVEMLWDPEFIALMGEKKMPREFIDLVTTGETGMYRYYKYKEDPESGEIKLKSEFVLDSLGNSLVEIAFQDSQEPLTHIENIYREDGKMLTRKDLINNESFQYEYDDKGNLVKEPTIFSIINYRYDNQSNAISKIETTEDGQSIFNVTLTRIDYRK